MGCSCGKATAVSAVEPVASNETGKVAPSAGESIGSKAAPSKAPQKAPAASPEVIASKVKQAISTRVLPLRECGLKSLPPAAVESTHAVLRTADLSENLIATLPEQISTWNQLQNLLCPNNKLERLPAAIGSLSNLQKLVLSGNQIQSLPPSLAELGKLKIIALDSNKLDGKQCDVFNGVLADALEDLDLSGNSLKELPPSLCNLRALTRLVVATNKLSTLPEAVGGLLKLQRLDAADNLLAAVPATVFDCPMLSELWLKGNPIDRLKLQEMQGFGKFMERRKQRIDSKIDSHVVGAVSLSVCGLD